jgi:hypothetical protein
VIEVKAESFKKVPEAGCNVMGIVSAPGETIEIYSDEKWKASVDGQNWKDVVVKKYPQSIVRPDFETRRPSWFERW